MNPVFSADWWISSVIGALLVTTIAGGVKLAWLRTVGWYKRRKESRASEPSSEATGGDSEFLDPTLRGVLELHKNPVAVADRKLSVAAYSALTAVLMLLLGTVGDTFATDELAADLSGWEYYLTVALFTAYKLLMGGIIAVPTFFSGRAALIPAFQLAAYYGMVEYGRRHGKTFEQMMAEDPSMMELAPDLQNPPLQADEEHQGSELPQPLASP